MYSTSPVSIVGYVVMTVEERIRAKYPRFKDVDVKKRVDKYDLYRRELFWHVAEMIPRLCHSPKYLDCERVAPALLKHTYGDICEYGWALKHLDGFDTVVSVAEEFGLTVNYEAPADVEDYISPVIFYGYTWELLSWNKIFKYSELAGKTLHMGRSSHQVSIAQRDALRARGIKARSGRFELHFDAIEDDYIKQYEEKGCIVFPQYVRGTAEAIERIIQTRYPKAHLQFDRDLGVVIR